jgi:hypothetical protein
MGVSSSNIPGSDLDTTDSAGIRGGTDATIIGNVLDALKVVLTDAVDSKEYPTYTAYFSQIAPGNLKSMASLLNAAGSTSVIKIREINIVNVQTTAVVGVIVNFRAKRITGHSVGTSVTPLAHDTSDILNVNVTARTGSTVAGESASFFRSWYMSSDEWGVGTADVESNQHDIQAAIPLYDNHPGTKPITLRAGEGLTIKCETNTAVSSFDVILTFTQE